ncbi:hypothetical protein DPMN_017718 [Dreissena polymorpha]|uniref:Peptidase A2 domain-containing protein n=1 Tax=Dreissena polymorpha TaxID=45954 RepID=A0A9D4NDT3_DREPO|nr:hypothetical protein DPMN_017718 [Dreissena polymorpha]
MPVPAKQSVQQEVVRVSHTSSISLFCMNVQVGDIVVNAVVDSASEVSIISEKVYKSMKHPPPKLRNVKLLTAGKDMSMQGFIVGPIKLKIGNCWYKEQLYVAPIDTDMLLGFDILVNTGKAILNMAEATLIFDGQVLSLNLGSTDGQPWVAEVRVGKRRVIPPNSVVRVKCNMSKFETDLWWNHSAIQSCLSLGWYCLRVRTPYCAYLTLRTACN